ncbi:MAG: peptidylprolyl isomerase [Gammaproteobacteria bacterium]|nr:peptidylprolyl isomerase [Gammaproteobacteria bacterium]NIR84478.1 peptidylprolyl isomerase [Gammaproteobacteria bacterium]NIR90381.1 peptidylprolyl isomerase [Gammaproteobacteria bacterium]NIU05529.1 peptidylprolyl isomerase [Gammaproteobacteria bacterium]NIV52668.1 peptidylprolyl isomerase [Gammaproteobacteria bacterium]
MAQANKGKTVKVHYKAKLDDGSVVDSSEGRDPLEVTLGEGKVIKGVEDALFGMEEGESKTASVAADEAYGPHRQEWVVTVERSKLPDDLDPEIGDQLQIKQNDGQAIPVRVTEVSDETVTLDANHPLAGEDLTFELEVVKVG